MRLIFSFAMIAVAVVTAGNALAALSPRTVGGVAGCLAARQVMATPSTVHVVAPKSPQGASLGVSFAMLQDVALNNAVLGFERSNAVATRVGNDWLTYQLTRYKKAGLRVTAVMVRQTYFVKDNVVVIWSNEPGTTTAGRSRAQRILQRCI